MTVDERTESFVRDFLLPFWQVENKDLVVTDVLGADFADGFSEAGHLAADQEQLYAQIFYRANACVRTEVPWPHRDALALSVAAHDLIRLADPKLSRRKLRKHLPEFTQTLERLSPLARHDQLAVRWAVLHQLEQCARKDTTVRFWIGKRTYRGRDVPARMLRLPRLRRVRQSSREVHLRDAWPEELEQAVPQLWTTSPLSWLENAERFKKADPRPNDTVLVVLLKDPGLRAFIAQRLLGKDLGWLRWLLSEASPPLKETLQLLALDLHAYGAQDPALDDLSAMIPLRIVNLFHQRMRQPSIHKEADH